MLPVNQEEKDNQREAYETNLLQRTYYPLGGLMTFNAEYGFLESMLRGYRSGFLTEFEYGQLCMCETLDDVRLTLGDTDFKLYLQNLPANQQSIEPILEKCKKKTIDEFNYIRRQAVGSLASFLEFITYEYLIQSIQFIITSLIKGSNPETLIAKCHPLGRSAHLKPMLTFENFENVGDKNSSGDGLLELYRTVLIDTPVAIYFEKYFNSEIKADQSPREIQRHYDENEIGVITNTLEKLWLEDFYAYSQTLGGETAAAMKVLLEFEADRRAIQITINSFNTPLNTDENRPSKRNDLYCTFGTLYPYSVGEDGFRKVKDMETLKQFLAPYTIYSELLRRSVESGKSVLSLLYEYEVRLNVLAFMGQSHFACFYAYTKLKQQEERNLQWILRMIKYKASAKEKNRWIKIF